MKSHSVSRCEMLVLREAWSGEVGMLPWLLLAMMCEVHSHEVPRETRDPIQQTVQQVFRVEGVRSSTGPVVPPQFMTDLYKMITDSNGVARSRNPYNASVVRSFIERENSKPQFFYFNISGLEATEKVLKAEFHLFRRHPTPLPLSPGSPYYQIRLFQVLNESRLDNSDHQRLLNVRPVSAHTSGWEVFNVKAAVLDWVNNKIPNKGFLVTTTNIFGDSVDVQFARRDIHDNSKQPILVLFDSDGVKRPRSSETPSQEHLPPYPHHGHQSNVNVTQGSSEPLDHPSTQDSDRMPPDSGVCARRHLFVDFAMIGLDSWVISPKGYNAYYCQGACEFPLSERVKPTNHAIVQSVVRQTRLEGGVGWPCCVPSSLQSVGILSFDEQDNFLLKIYEDMVVDTCGCH